MAYLNTILLEGFSFSAVLEVSLLFLVPVALVFGILGLVLNRKEPKRSRLYWIGLFFFSMLVVYCLYSLYHLMR